MSMNIHSVATICCLLRSVQFVLLPPTNGAKEGEGIIRLPSLFWCRIVCIVQSTHDYWHSFLTKHGISPYHDFRLTAIQTYELISLLIPA